MNKTMKYLFTQENQVRTKTGKFSHKYDQVNSLKKVGEVTVPDSLCIY